MLHELPRLWRRVSNDDLQVVDFGCEWRFGERNMVNMWEWLSSSERHGAFVHVRKHLPGTWSTEFPSTLLMSPPPKACYSTFVWVIFVFFSAIILYGSSKIFQPSPSHHDCRDIWKSKTLIWSYTCTKYMNSCWGIKNLLDNYSCFIWGSQSSVYKPCGLVHGSLTNLKEVNDSWNSLLGVHSEVSCFRLW